MNDLSELAKQVAKAGRETLRYKRRANITIALVTVIGLAAIGVSIATRESAKTIRGDVDKAARDTAKVNREQIERSEVILCALGRLVTRDRKPDPQLMIVLRLLKKIDCDTILAGTAARPSDNGESVEEGSVTGRIGTGSGPQRQREKRPDNGETPPGGGDTPGGGGDPGGGANPPGPGAQGSVTVTLPNGNQITVPIQACINNPNLAC